MAGKKNFPSVTQRELLMASFDGPEQYEKDMFNWIEERGPEDIEHLTFE